MGIQGLQGSQGPMGTPGLSDPQSAFRAENSADSQPYQSGNLLPVIYPNEIFDLNNEYNTANSQFIPSQSGVYSIYAGVFFQASSNQNYQAFCTIRVNNALVYQNDRDVIIAPGILIAAKLINAYTLVQINAGDIVNVTFSANQPGTVLANSAGTIFAAARFPSP
ncbi:ABC transporter permease [Bacillus sp. SM2101]|uniref:ABC transporter permease n=1 Tax=Bacillus sp. SM2101 TaxID=2805366 RepID=UPI001BDF2FCD|nr:ABC transporter permease [Bacillus sp. SM2101]